MTINKYYLNKDQLLSGACSAYISKHKDPKLLSTNIGTIEDYIWDNDRYPFFITLAGSYMHGFESPESDQDFRAVHVSESNDYLSLDNPSGRVLEKEGLQNNIGVVSYDIGQFCAQLLKMNCNMLEQLFAETVVYVSPNHIRQFFELQMYVQSMLSKKGMFDSYNGLMTANYKKYIINDNHVTNKKYLYIVKNGLSLQYALKYNQIESNINNILKENLGYNSDELELMGELVERKREGLGDDTLTAQKEQLDALVNNMFIENAERYEHCNLQEKPSDLERKMLNLWVTELRKTY